MASYGNELDIVRHYVDLIEKETKGLCNSDGLNPAHLEEILHGEESTLEEALDRLLRATLAENVCLLGDTDLPQIDHSVRPPERIHEANAFMKLVNGIEDKPALAGTAPQSFDRLSDASANVLAENTDTGRGTVEVLKRKLSMLTAGIRLLHTQIEEKSLELFGGSEVEVPGPSQALQNRRGELLDSDAALLTSSEVAPSSSSIVSAGKARQNSPKRKQDLSAQKRPPSVGRTTSPSGRRSSSPRGSSTSRSMLGNQRAGTPGRQPQSARGSLGRRGTRDLGIAAKVDCWQTSSPRQRSDSKSQGTPQKERLSIGNRAANDTITGRSVGLHKEAQANKDAGGNSKPQRTPRGNAFERCYPHSHVPVPAAAANSNVRHPGGSAARRGRSANPETDVAGELELPPNWKNLLSDAYRDVTGRPLVDRIRLLESSSASGRRADTPHVFWLHTMVRWGDMRIIGSDRVPERGEDLTLFVVHSHLQASDCERGHTEARTWNVASVRVLNSLSSVCGPGQSEQRELIGRLGAILLYDALGPLLAGEHDVPKEWLREPPPHVAERFVSQGELPTPALVSPVLSPLLPAPRVVAPAFLPTGSLSVPTPVGSLRSHAFVSSPAGVSRNSLGGSLLGPVGGALTPMGGSLTPLSVGVVRQVSVGTPAVPTSFSGSLDCRQPPPIAQVVTMPQALEARSEAAEVLLMALPPLCELYSTV
eukprot:CAMPEP_0169107840 /NCGR_PEP_ID=MMETSP1015-20121227/25105_1 /TAXON_ID=342587 /ORGANISM="Karlodinium micrum, Strain CCMP2283" /LENGTH=706 /DNA_ID=CAMNT_0009169415 /DNA_START=45 /DNA_END=2166 /DNA_ORIENTATION=+